MVKTMVRPATVLWDFLRFCRHGTPSRIETPPSSPGTWHSSTGSSPCTSSSCQRKPSKVYLRFLGWSCSRILEMRSGLQSVTRYSPVRTSLIKSWNWTKPVQNKWEGINCKRIRQWWTTNIEWGGIVFNQSLDKPRWLCLGRFDPTREYVYTV